MSTVTCSVCNAESTAGKKFCAECGAPLPLVCPACGHPAAASQGFCAECGAALLDPAAGPQTVPATARPSTVAPREERRLVTALFCDLVGFTSLAERLDPEDVREVQAAYFSAMASQIERYGGLVEKYAGDAVLALFGVPLAHEDDPERAVLCALGMQRAMHGVAEAVKDRYGVEVAIRIGVNTGEVVSGSWNASGRQQAAVSGDAMNVAARIQAAAEPGGVLVGEQTRRLTRRLRYGERQDLAVKGKAAPVAGYAALGRREETGEGAASPLPLVGRKRELGKILAAWERAAGGEGRVLTVAGEPGVGKSRLVAEALGRIREARGPLVLRARSLSYGQSVSLWLVADLVRSLCSIPEDAGVETVREKIDARLDEVLASCDETDRAIARDVLGEVLGLTPGGSLVAQADPRTRRSSLVRSLNLVLGSLAARGPVVLVLEDLHWVDTPSQEILEAIVRDVPGRPILVLVTQRPGWSARWEGESWAEQIALRPLEKRAAAALAKAVLGGARLSEELESHLRERAEGNPFFVEELVRYLQETGGLEQRDGQTRLRPGVAERLPTTLTEVLLARLDRLEGQVKAVAQVGSVIGRSFAVKLLSRVMEREEAMLENPLHALQEADITYPQLDVELQHIFRHALLRDAAYSMLLRRRQRQLHLQVARAIAKLYPTDEYLEMIVYHYARTEEDAEAAEWLEKAGDRAQDTYANEAAIAHYRTARERLERSGADALALARVEAKRGAALNRLARFPEGETLLESAIARYEAAGRPELAGQAVADLAHALNQQGRPEEARQRATAMIEMLAPLGPSSEEIQLLLLLTDVYQNTGRYAEMLAAAERMGEVAAALENKKMLARAYDRRGMALRHLGRTQEAIAALEEAARRLEDVGDVRGLALALNGLAENKRTAGDLAGAVHLVQRGLELGSRIGEKRTKPISHLNLAQLALLTGEWKQARKHIDQAEELARAMGRSPIVEVIVLHARGELALLGGHWDEARGLLQAAMERASGIFQQVVELALVDLAELDILEGRPEAAIDRLAGLPEAAERRNVVLAWARLELGEAPQALELVDREERKLREQQTLFDLPEVRRIKGMALKRLGRSGEVRAILTAAREQARPMPNPYAEAQILVELGLTDRELGDEAQARAHLGEALAIFRRLGAAKGAERAQRELAVLDPSA